MHGENILKRLKDNAYIFVKVFQAVERILSSGIGCLIVWWINISTKEFLVYFLHTLKQKQHIHPDYKATCPL